jgi:hypothetical protein
MSDPTTALGEAMITLHEMYLSAKEAGFTEAQAMQLVIATMLKDPPK